MSIHCVEGATVMTFVEWSASYFSKLIFSNTYNISNILLSLLTALEDVRAKKPKALDKWFSTLKMILEEFQCIETKRG